MATWWTRLRGEMDPHMKDLRAAVYGSGGAPMHHAGLIALWGGEPQALSATDIREGKLSDIDVIVFPGGGLRAMEGMLAPLGIDGAKAVREWVADGGMYIGSCAGSFLPACTGQVYWQAHAEAKELYMVSARLANGGDSEWEGLTSPGVGVLRYTVARPEHWLAEGLPEQFELVHYNGPMFMLGASEPAFDQRFPLSPPEGVVRFSKATEQFTPSEGFMAEPPGPTLFERCVQQEAFSAISSAYGKGLVVLYGSHPEFGFDVMQLGWGQGTRLFANALKHQAKTRAERPKGDTGTAGGQATAASLRASLEQLSERLERISVRYEHLGERIPTAWLREGQTPSFMGRSAQTLWQEGLARGRDVSKVTAAYLAQLAQASESTNLAKASKWLDHEPPLGQDYGFVGLRQLVRTVEKFIDDGEQKLATEPFAMEHPYDGFLEHPFHLLVGSYLSALGLTAAIALSSAVIGSISGFGAKGLEDVLVLEDREAVTL